MAPLFYTGPRIFSILESKPYSFSLKLLISLSLWISLLKKGMEVENQNIHPTKSPQNCTVNQALREMTALYLEQHSSLSLNSLANRCGVPATTMRRLMQEENRSELAPHSVLALVSYIKKEKKISRLLKIVDGPIAILLRKCFDQFIFDDEKSDHKMDNDLNEVLRDKTAYLIYKLAANHCGVSLEEIKNALGLIGLTKTQELLNQSWLIKDSHGQIHAKEKNFTLDLTIAHQHTHILLDQYKPTEVKAGFNLFYSLSEAMNSEGIKRIKEIEKEAVKKIFDLMNMNEMKGDIPYFALMMSEAIGPYQYEQNETNQSGVQ